MGRSVASARSGARAAADATVADAMVRRPLICPASVTTGEVRELLRDEHLHAVLLLDGSTLVAVVEREDLESDGDPVAPARLLGRVRGRTIAPDADLENARRQLLETGRRRLAVVDENHRLLGLLCLKRTGLGFCSDADVAARTCDNAEPVPPVGLEPTLRPF
ncbi:CBS domain-containing protein [uncultured Jatrophihabitans sp.]|uniref:CBS domain-containing protein n=1 Tax=uncultured Jatrophihabitans sp. TaxID=1610747 RepID=UPI0035CB506E